MPVFLQMDPTNSHGFLFGRFNLRGPPACKLETKQQKPQEEEIPIQAMVALRISKKRRTHHQPYDLPIWGQIKTLTKGLACCNSWGHKESVTTERLNWTELNQAENLISQQGMPPNPENIFLLCLLCLLLLPPLRLTWLITLIGLIYLTPPPFYCRL